MAIRLSLAALFLIAWLIILLPLKAVMILGGGAAAFGYQDVYGSVWSGRIYGLQAAGQRVREIEVSLAPLPLMLGRAQADWRVSDVDLRGDGRTSVSGDWLRADDVSLSVSLGRLGLDSLPGLSRSETVRISVIELEMDGDRCIRAAGDVRSGALASYAQGFGIEGPVLEGILECQGDDLVLEFSGDSPNLTVNGHAILRRTGYDWTLEARSDRGELADVFALAGLERQDDHWVRSGSARYGE